MNKKEVLKHRGRIKMEYVAILVYTFPTFMEKIKKQYLHSDAVYVINKEHDKFPLPTISKKYKEIIRINFTDSRDISDIMDDFADNCDGRVAGIPLPRVGLWPTGSCVDVPHKYRDTLKKKVEDYFSKK